MKLLNAHSWSDIEQVKEQRWAKAQKARDDVADQRDHGTDSVITLTDPRGEEMFWGYREQQQGLTAFSTTFGITMRIPEGYAGPKAYFNQVVKDRLDWFDENLYEYQGQIIVPPAHNLVVNTGLHISAQRTFVTTAGATLTPVASSTNDGVRNGGVDNNATAVVATTSQFDTTAANRFIVVADSDPTYSTANKRITMLWGVADTDTGIDHQRYGQNNDLSNGADTLFSMISGFLWQPGSNAYDWTIESRTDWAGA